MFPDQKWLFCRPAGGLRDSLNQLDRACSYAIRFRRTLLLDSSRSGFQADFLSVWRIRESLTCPVVPVEAIADPSFSRRKGAGPDRAPVKLMESATALAAVLRDRLGYDDGDEAPVGMDGDFDASSDHPARMLVFRSFGGGHAAIRMLRHLELLPDIADRVLQRVASLGQGYAALHVRHTDYRSDPEDFLRRVRPSVRGRTVLLCTDNREVVDLARAILGADTDLRTLVELPDIDGLPIHKAAAADPVAHAVDLLTDLIAMASARRFFFAPLVARVGDERNFLPVYSGFSLLALQLRLCPEVLDGLLAAGHGELRATSGRGDRMRRLLEWVPTPGTGRGLGFLRMQRHLMRVSRRLLSEERLPGPRLGQAMPTSAEAHRALA